ncbi:MAG: ABC transporter ATP-binding protein [Phycisphaerales bacterium]|nr:ABC transporter ATP-binding protein [Phycisphaerales bacterium]
MIQTSKQRYREFRRVGFVEDDAGAQAANAQTAAATSAQSATPINHPRGAKQRSNTKKPYLREYIAWLRPFFGSLAIVFLLAVLTGLLSLLMPRATMYIIDDVLPNKNAALLHRVGAALLAIVVVQQSLDWLRNWRMATLNSRVLFRLRLRLFRHLLRLALHELSQMKTGGIVTRLMSDIDSVTGLLQMAVITPGVALVKIVMVLAMLLWINWQMAVAAILLLPPIVVLNLFSIRRIRPIYRSLRRDRSEIDGRLVETFGGIRVVRAFRREAAEARRFAVANHTAIRKGLLARAYEALVGAGWGLLIPLCSLLVIWLGGTLVLMDKATLGGVMAFQMYLMMLLMPVSSIVQSYGDTQQALAAMERLFDTLRRPVDKPDRPGAIDLPSAARLPGARSHLVQRLEIENVTFAYPSGQTALSEINLDVRGGWTVALVGSSGAGKTTLTNLVARFYDPVAGSIRLNGVDLRDIKLASYRQLLGFVQQDVFLFDGTIAENIAYARKHATRDEIEAAARRANAHEFVASFARGYDTPIGERGVRLSGGQAQRISIARAILADPRILILDEATSNLDTESEQLIQASMRELLTDRTTFVIAHRLSTVAHADLIVVLEDGRIMETGTHEELLARDSRYRVMVERQQRAMREATEPASWFA